MVIVLGSCYKNVCFGFGPVLGQQNGFENIAKVLGFSHVPVLRLISGSSRAWDQAKEYAENQIEDQIKARMKDQTKEWTENQIEDIYDTENSAFYC